MIISYLDVARVSRFASRRVISSQSSNIAAIASRYIATPAAGAMPQVSSMYTPVDLLRTLYETELAHQERLLHVLGRVKPGRGGTLAALLRGLFTKNGKLLALLSDSLALQGPEAFKQFINSFILWFDDALVILAKYARQLEARHDAAMAEPIAHCNDYVEFIEYSRQRVRNPFVCERLELIAAALRQLTLSYQTLLRSQSLDDIGFAEVRPFGGADKVSSYFRLDQIVERSGPQEWFLGNEAVELVCLNLTALAAFDAVALLTRPPSGSPSLIYPPLRVNEVLIERRDDALELSALDFGAHAAATTLSLANADRSAVAAWLAKLERIFPRPQHLPVTLGPRLQIASLGLGISVDAPAPAAAAAAASPVLPPPPFRDLIDSPTVLPLGRLQHQFLKLCELLPPAGPHSRPTAAASPRPPQTRSSLHLLALLRYDQLVSSIVNATGEQQVLRDIRRVDVESTLSARSDDRPRLCRAEVVNLSACNSPRQAPVPPLPVAQHHFASVPNLPTAAQPLYQNAALSEIDVSRFGQNHNPSFSVHQGLNSLLEEPPARTKSSFLRLFKKKPRTRNVHNLSIEATLTCAEPGPSSASSVSTTSPSAAAALPSPFELPSSTSRHFFSASVDEADLSVPQPLKDLINASVDFYLSPSVARTLIVSKWKQRYGKYELLTTNEMVFVKLVIHYATNQSWMLFFKEVNEGDEVVDVPILLLNLCEATTTLQSALDYQISSVNAVTNQKMTVMVRCALSAVLNAIDHNVDAIRGILGFDKRKPVVSKLSSTLTLLLMDTMITSSTYTSLNSNAVTKEVTSPSSAFPNPTQSSYALDLLAELDYADILNNPDNEKFLLLQNMKIRLQRNVEDYGQIHNPSSWKILSMNNLSIYQLVDSLTGTTYYNLVVEGPENYNWLISSEDKFKMIEKIGKAGMVLKLSEREIFLIECKGKREFKEMFELF